MDNLNESEIYVKERANQWYIDGNGRMGRFLMNMMLAAGGYPWTVIPTEKRDDYMEALERASADQDIAPFADFLGALVSGALKSQQIRYR